jgi:hypothetical protein
MKRRVTAIPCELIEPPDENDLLVSSICPIQITSSVQLFNQPLK